MSTDEAAEKLEASLLALDGDLALEEAERIAQGGDSQAIERAIAAMSRGLAVVGQRFQEGEWFLTELVYAGEISKDVVTRLTAKLEGGDVRRAGTLVVGTVRNDLHDLGKDIFACLARGAGFEVVDLGVNVTAERFLDAVAEHEPLALGLSCLLTSTDVEVENVIAEAVRRGVRDRLKIIVGGAALTEAFAQQAGADAFAPDAVTGVQIVTRWSEA